MRVFIPVAFVALFALPALALVVNNVYFPVHIEQRLNESAQSGDLSNVTSEAERLTNLYPSYEGKIAAYVKNVATPATRIMSAMKDLSIGTNQAHAASENEQALAADLNTLETGAAK